MENEPGDDYIRRISSYIRTHEQGLAAAGLTRRRRTKNLPSSATSSILDPLGWFSSSDPQSTARPVVLSIDCHHLFYLLIRLEALSIDVGSLDTKVDNPSRPMNYINVFPHSDKSETLSMLSFQSSLSAISRLSIGTSWWGRPSPPSVDSELRYIYSSFTKLPALSLHAPEAKLIAELANESPNENALPLDSFKNLQTLQCTDIDPRTLLGWDRLAESLRSLTIKRSGIEDVSDVFISAVMDDQARREGRISSTRVRKFSRIVSRQTSFHSTPLPDSVAEDAEDADSTLGADETPKPTTPVELPSLKWAFLRHLCLAENALTFVPSSTLNYLTSVTHLDLSSNLLVSVPPALSSLYNLVSLNLSDNMIDSVLGIYTMLGQVLHLNLSRNRLESICGLERLLALERVDLRHNLIEESAEVGRLATLPNIAEVWVEGNPLVDIEEGYRIRCFDLFTKEGKNIALDGSVPGFYEKQYMTALPSEQMTSSRPISIAQSPPVVPVGSPTPGNQTKSNSSIRPSPVLSPQGSSPHDHSSPQMAAVNGRGRRKKNLRIVDLDGRAEGSDSGSTRSGSHARSNGARRSKATRNAGTSSVIAIPEQEQTGGLAEPGPSTQSVLEDSSISAIAVAAPPRSTVQSSMRSHHRRSQSEFTSASIDLTSADPTSPDAPASSSQAWSVQSKPLNRFKAAARRARVTTSVYEPPLENGNGEEEGDQFKEADAYRARIEALRSDMGEGWLKVFNQSQLGSPGVTSG